MSSDDEVIGPSVFDEGDGIALVIPLSDGLSLTYSMTDDAAEDLISIIRNKLNARF